MEQDQQFEEDSSLLNSNGVEYSVPDDNSGEKEQDPITNLTTNTTTDETNNDTDLTDDVLNAVSKYKDGTSKSVKKTRRKFQMNIATDEVFNLPPMEQEQQPPLSPNSSNSAGNTNFGASATFSPTSILSKNNKITPQQQPQPSSSSTLSPFKPSPLSFSSGILPPSSRIDESPPTLGKYQLLHHLGQSYLGNTFSAVPPDSSEYVAIKLIDRERMNLIHQNILSNEFQLLKSLKHSGIVNYIGMINDNTGFGIVQEFYENGSLSDIYNRSGAFQESLLAKYTLQILEALGYIHSQGIVHRNLKSNNVLLAKGGKVKISDFAIGIKSSAIDPSIRFSLNGYPFWTSPEVLSMKPFNHKVDSWSIGCLIMELVVGHPPFSHLGPMEALVEIINPSTTILPYCLDENEQSLFSQELSQFLELCFKKEPSERASVHDLLRHPWLSMFNDSNANSNASQAHPTVPSTNSNNVNSRTGEFYSLDFLSQFEQNEKEISKILSSSDQLDTSSNQIDLKKFQFKHYIKKQDNEVEETEEVNLSTLSKDQQIEKLKSIIDHNDTMANNLKYTMQEVLQEQTKYYEICESMKSKTLEILNQNKTGARISAHSNSLLKRTNQMANDLGRKYEILQSNIKRLEDYLITKDDCAKKLANVVYRNKISFDSLLNPTLAANLLYQLGSKTWKKGQEKRAFATLKDNFLFFFKNEKSSYPIDVIYLNDKRNISITSIQDSKKKAYIICIGTTIHDQNNLDNNNNNNESVNLSSSPGSLVNSTSNPSISNSQNNNSNVTNSNNNCNSNSNGNNSNNTMTPSISIPSGKESKEGGKEIKEKEKEKEKDKDKEKEKEKEKDKDKEKDKEKDSSKETNSNSSNGYNGSETIWCLLAFDNSKNMENWYGVLDSVVPWYDKRAYEISKPTLPIENKKHQKQKSLDSTNKQSPKSLDAGGDVSWKKESGGIKFQGVVGVRLDDLMTRESPTAELPYFLSKMLKFLEKNVDEEGILRLSGSSTEILEMKAQLQRGESIDYTYKDPHAVTGLLKLFLRELPESILPEHLRIQSTEILSNSRWAEKEKIKEIQTLLSNLSRPHYNVLKHMLFFAKLVVDRSEYNKMVIANVTTCFSPTLRIPPGLFNFLINTYDLSFPKFNLSV
ncbi:hypothetical protein RB653_003625 [Dictyostelium firmibasis]|uniref:Uncharacterized protein n=1 Tax=Dictyostelium firmibasis TaxID=79012 RepID=A0AAN7U8C5_9MYCE